MAFSESQLKKMLAKVAPRRDGGCPRPRGAWDEEGRRVGGPRGRGEGEGGARSALCLGTRRRGEGEARCLAGRDVTAPEGPRGAHLQAPGGAVSLVLGDAAVMRFSRGVHTE